MNTYQREAELQAKEPAKLLDRTFETTRKYAEAVVGIGKGEGIPVIDIWTALYDAAGKDERALSRFLYDGLHLNAAGYEVGSLLFVVGPSSKYSMDLMYRYCTMPLSMLFPRNSQSFTMINSSPFLLRKYRRITSTCLLGADFFIADGRKSTGMILLKRCWPDQLSRNSKSSYDHIKL